MFIGVPLSKRSSWVGIACFISVLYLIGVGGLPSEIPYAPHDDGLFLRWAASIDAGEWLGSSYGKLTLTKGPFHSFLIASLHRLGLNPAFGLRSLYLLASLLFATTVLARTRNWIRAAALVCLLFDPWMFVGTAFALRMLREASYVPIQLFALGAAVLALDQALHASRLRFQFWIPWCLSAVCFGLLLITREARFVITALSAEAILLFILCLRISLSRRFFEKAWKSIFSAILIFLLLVQLPVFALSQVNRSAYGTLITNEFEDGAFKSFYQDLISVQTTESPVKPWVPLNQATMDEIVKLAPKTVLGETLQAMDPGWKQFGCDQHQQTCGEYAGGWLMWAWRNALFKTYKPRSADRFQRLTQRAHHDLKRLCLQHASTLHCDSSALGYLPLPSRWGHPQGATLAYSQAFLQLMFALVSPRSYQPLIAYSPANQEWPRASGLGIKLPSAQDTVRLREYWLVRDLFRIGMVSRVFMLILLLIEISRKLRLFVQAFLNPGSLLLLSALVLQLTVLSLIHVTSFDSFSYLGIVSPLLTALVWRWISMLEQDQALLTET